MEGSSALAHGIVGGTKSLADSLTSMMDRRKQENDRAKASEALFKSTPELQKALNVDPETFKGMSAAEKNELVRAGLGKLSLMESLQGQAREREAANLREVEFSKQRGNEAGFNAAVAGMEKPDLMGVIKAGAQNNQLTTPNFDNLLRSMEAGQPRGPITLPPGFVPKNVSVDQTGKATTSYGPEKDEKPLLGDYPWLYDENLDNVVEKIRKIGDPQQRSLAVAARNDFEVMKGRPSMLERFMFGTSATPGAGGKSQPAASQFNKGDRAKQNGVIYEYDGKNWNPVP